MASCRICLEDMKRPVSLPCGHIFCSQCIMKTVQAAKPYTHLQPCPTCRSVYNIAPINLNVVPANLRLFITPSIRRVYIDHPLTSQEENITADVNEQSVGSSTTAMTSSESELARLRLENHALRNDCAMWRKRAEMHGTANLGLLKFARVVRDQASLLARERDELTTRCQSLKRKIEDDEMEKYSEAAMVDAFLGHSGPQDFRSPGPGSLLFAPSFRYMGTSGYQTRDSTASDPTDPTAEDSDSNRPRKRSKTEDEIQGFLSAKRTTSASENLVHGQGKATIHNASAP